jgi:hypothetical protein
MTEQQTPEQPGLLSQLRNNWEFASLMQYIAIFGQVMKIDEEFGIEVCLFALSGMKSVLRLVSHWWSRNIQRHATLLNNH